MLIEHEIEIRVRYPETDPQGVVHHSTYFTYFEMGRIELLRASGGSHLHMEESGLFPVVVKASCRYHKPARYDDLLQLRTTVTRITYAKIEHEHRLLRGTDLLAVGQITLALVDRHGVAQPVPEQLRAELPDGAGGGLPAEQ